MPDASRDAFGDTSAQDRAVTPVARNSKLFWGGVALLISVVVLLGLKLLPWLSADTSLRLSALRFDRVIQSPFVVDVSGYANIVAARAPTLYAELAGTVVYSVEAGRAVQQGEPLAQIENPELLSRLQQEQSNQASLEAETARQRISNARIVLERERARDEAQINATAALREQERARRGFEKQAISDVEFRRSEDAVAAANLRLTAATKDLALERDSLGLELRSRGMQVDRQRLVVRELLRQQSALTLRAPFAGVIGSRLVADRASVAANTGVLTVVDLKAFELDFSVSELYARRLQPGQHAEVSREGEKYSAEVKAISPEIIAGQVAVRVRFSEGEPEGLKQNQRLLVRVELSRKDNAKSLARGAYLDTLGGRSVWLQQGDKLLKRDIQLGELGAERVEILSGLEVGDRVCLSEIKVSEQVKEVYLHR